MRSRVRFDERLARGYEGWYETAGRRADVREKSLFREILRAFPGERTLLEVGCGTGHFTRWFAEEGLTTTGLDVSPPMLREAFRRETGTYLLADATSLPFSDGEFDLAALVTTLEFVSEPERALVEAVRVARRGVVLGVLNRWSLLALKRRLRGGTVWRQARFFSSRELRRLVVRAAGARLRRLRIRSALSLPGLEFAARLLPVGGFISVSAMLHESGSPGEAES